MQNGDADHYDYDQVKAGTVTASRIADTLPPQPRKLLPLPYLILYLELCFGVVCRAVITVAVVFEIGRASCRERV